MQGAAESSLISRAAKGDQKAFRSLVESHQAFAYGLAHRYTQETNDAEDITQEAFLRIWKNLHRYDPQFPFRSWLARIVTNLCLDYLKSARRKYESGKTKAVDMRSVTDAHAPGSELETTELNAIVAQLAQGLTKIQRAVFVLRDLESLSTEEVCKVLNVTAGNMKSNLYYARLKIREGLVAWYKS